MKSLSRMLRRRIASGLSVRAKLALKDWSARGGVDILLGRDTPVPPRSMVLAGGGDYESVGNEFKTYIVDFCALRPADKVLDVGCGAGRMARPLTSLLSDGGEYQGFDIGRKEIDWCRKNITRRFPIFHFTHCDLHNKFYNPRGKSLASLYRFDFDDEHFDVVLVTSVFTHMLPADLRNYISEISRVLKPGGRCLMSFFILNEESDRLIIGGESALGFVHEMDGYRCINPAVPEEAMAYREDIIVGLCEQHGIEMDEPIRYGSWCGRDDFLSYQDIVVGTRR